MVVFVVRVFATAVIVVNRELDLCCLTTISEVIMSWEGVNLGFVTMACLDGSDVVVVDCVADVLVGPIARVDVAEVGVACRLAVDVEVCSNES